MFDSRRYNYSRMLTLAACLLLSACDGGGGSSTIGGTQSDDPVVQDFPIAYIKRPVLYEDNDGVMGDLLTTNVREATAFYPGAELFIRDRASPSAPELSLTAGIFPDDEDGNPPLYDVKDISSSADGMRLVFAMRAPEDPNLDDDEPPGFENAIGETETDFGRHEAECAGCEQFHHVNESGLCENCSQKLERDLIRKRDWAYSVTAYGMSDERREDMRRQIVDNFGEGLELVAPPRQIVMKRKRRNRRGCK